MSDLAITQADTEQRIAIESARLVPGINPDEPWILVVEGEARCANMEVSLRSLPAIPEIEYWPVEVIGRLPGGICLEAMKEYTAVMPGPPMGTEGIEVIGSNQSIKVPKNA